MATQKSPKVSTTDVNPFLPASPLDLLRNPFAHVSPFAARSTEVPADAPEGSYTYKLVQSGLDVPAEECELQATAVEIAIRWGTTVLHVAHLTPPRSFHVGEAPKCDFFLPAERLGVARMPLVLVKGPGDLRLVIPAGASGAITLAGEPARPVAELLASGKAEPSTELPGAHEIAFSTGSRAEIEVGGIALSIATVKAGRNVGAGSLLDSSALPYQGLSLLLHASLLAAAALFVPTLAMAADEDRMSDEQRYLIATKLEQIAEREQDRKNEEVASHAGPDGAPAAVEAPSKVGPGTPGTLPRASTPVYAVKEEPGVLRPREDVIRDQLRNTMIDLVSPGPGASNALAWGPEANRDPSKSTLDNAWDGTLDDAFNPGGLRLSNLVGDEGEPFVNVDRIGTVGIPGSPGGPSGFDGRHRALRDTHQAKAPGTVRVGPTTLVGHLPPEVIQRIVRQNFGRFKLCYENGLRNNPSLQGRVTVNFVIGHEGQVSSAQSGGSDLPDSAVVSCVVGAFYGLSFPPPESGIVTVGYPIVFSPAS